MKGLPLYSSGAHYTRSDNKFSGGIGAQGDMLIAAVHGEHVAQLDERREFIVRACNSHDALVAALDDIRQIVADKTYPSDAMRLADISAAVERAALSSSKASS